MAYGITDQMVYNEIQTHLLEAPNNGASYGSGLFSLVEVVGRLNWRIREFVKLTSCVVKRSTSTNSTADTVVQSVPSDSIDILRVGYLDTSGNTIPIPRSSALEAELTVTDLVGGNAAVDVPSLYTYDDAAVTTISMFPPPDTQRAIDYIYVKQPTVMPASPNGTVIEVPDDFTPFIKYGVLADLWSKTGETHDPARAALCQQLYILGVEAARGMVGK